MRTDTSFDLKTADGNSVVVELTDFVRQIYFETSFEEAPLATFGGTVFIVNCLGRLFGFTARHVFGNEMNAFRCADLRVFPSNEVEPVNELIRPKRITGIKPLPGRSIDDLGDVSDLALIEFHSCPVMEKYSFPWRTCSFAHPEPDDKLLAVGCLKDGLSFGVIGDVLEARALFNVVNYDHVIEHRADKTLLRANSQISREYASTRKNLLGMSGSPIFNLTKGACSGMVLRAGIDSESFSSTTWFLSAEHMNQLLDCAITGKSLARYTVADFEPLS